ncbi:ABC transporter ATP-binding protein [Martelella endophytica]|nr:ABC transporter ATP-binding protein [Martelella endophytica]
MGQTAARLRFENIRHGYDHRDVISDVTLEAHPGEVLCLLGPSGSGKSTLLRIAAGLEMPRGGRLLIDGATVAGAGAFLPPEKRGIGLMFQDFALFPHMTVIANVAFGLAHLPKLKQVEAAREALFRVGLAGYEGKYPHMLSGGEQQRVALARALAPRPAVLMMDEPFSGLDARLKDQVRADTLAILRESGATVIIVTHDPEEAMGMADRIALLKDGALVQQGTPHDLFVHPETLFAASFFSEINILPGVVEGGSLMTPLGAMAISRPDGPVTIAVRHSDIRVLSHQTDGAIAAEITGRRYLGTAEHLDLQVDGHHIRARIGAGLLQKGAVRVFVEVAPQSILVFENPDQTS